MFFWFLFFIRLINVSCKPKIGSHDHIEEYLKNKTLEDVFEFNQRFNREKYLDSLQKLSDDWQPNLVFSDGSVLPCDPDWHQFSGTGCCYRTTTEKSSWYGGTNLCKALHPEAQMASFHSQAESEFVCKKYSPIHAWTGLSQTGTPGVWTYTDGTPDWHWFFAQSSSMTPESSCVEMMDGMLVLLFSWSAKKGQTQPYTCTEEIESICKYCPKETTTTTTTSTTTTTAPVTTTTTTTTTTTETTSTPTTTESTTSITTTEIKTTSAKTTESATTTTTPTTMSTTTPTTTQTLATTPTTILSSSPEMSTDTTTTAAGTTISILSTTSTALLTSSKSMACISSCPHPFIQFQNKCYKMCSGLVKFEDACGWCGGTTVIISNKDENDFISRTIGSNDQKISQVWIGNSESNGYLNWENGQPSKPNNGVDYCISMDLSAGPTRGKYKYLPCQNTVSHSICLMNS